MSVLQMILSFKKVFVLFKVSSISICHLYNQKDILFFNQESKNLDKISSYKQVTMLMPAQSKHTHTNTQSCLLLLPSG